MHQIVLPSPDGHSSPGAHLELGVHRPNIGFAFILLWSHSQTPTYYKIVHWNVQGLQEEIDCLHRLLFFCAKLMESDF